MKMPNNFKLYFAELIGTFILVFCGAGSIIINHISNGALGHVGISAAFGLVVMIVIYSIGEISGAHINPAVTIAFWIANKFDKQKLLPYISFQIVGAIIASGLLFLLFPEIKVTGATVPGENISLLQAFIMEFLLTFILMFVIINVSTGSKEMGVMAGISIGGTVALEALIGGPISGASMNPARSIAPAIFTGDIQYLWIYILAPVLGAGMAIFSCQLIKGKNCCVEKLI